MEVHPQATTLSPTTNCIASQMEEKYPISCLNLSENAFVLGQVNKERHMLNNKSNRGKMFFFSLQAWDKRNLI